jgi:hypothetical protein
MVNGGAVHNAPLSLSLTVAWSETGTPPWEMGAPGPRLFWLWKLMYYRDQKITAQNNSAKINAFANR